MKSLIKGLAAVLVLGSALSAASVNLVGVGASVSVLGLSVGAGAGVNIGYSSPVVRDSSSNVACMGIVTKTKCKKINSYGAPAALFEKADEGERVLGVDEYYCVQCPVCVTCN